MLHLIADHVGQNLIQQHGSATTRGMACSASTRKICIAPRRRAAATARSSSSFQSTPIAMKLERASLQTCQGKQVTDHPVEMLGLVLHLIEQISPG